MPKATTSKSATHFKPYDRSSQTPPSDDGVSQVDEEEIYKPKKTRTNEGGGGGKDMYKFTRVVLVTLLLAPAKPNWDAIAATIGKTRAQTYDVWRKSLLPNLLSNKPWSCGPGMEGKGVRTQIMLAVLTDLKPDWIALADYFPGRKRTQIFDLWRKTIVPRLERGDVIE